MFKKVCCQKRSLSKNLSLQLIIISLISCQPSWFYSLRYGLSVVYLCSEAPQLTVQWYLQPLTEGWMWRWCWVERISGTYVLHVISTALLWNHCSNTLYRLTRGASPHSGSEAETEVLALRNSCATAIKKKVFQWKIFVLIFSLRISAQRFTLTLPYKLRLQNSTCFLLLLDLFQSKHGSAHAERRVIYCGSLTGLLLIIYCSVSSLHSEGSQCRGLSVWVPGCSLENTHRVWAAVNWDVTSFCF